MPPRAYKRSGSMSFEDELPSFSIGTAREPVVEVGKDTLQEYFTAPEAAERQRQQRRRKSTTAIEATSVAKEENGNLRSRSKTPEGKRSYFPANTPRTPLKKSVKSKPPSLGDSSKLSRKPKTREDAPPTPSKDDSTCDVSTPENESLKKHVSSAKLKSSSKPSPATETRRVSKKVMEGLLTIITDDSLRESQTSVFSNESPKSSAEDRNKSATLSPTSAHEKAHKNPKPTELKTPVRTKVIEGIRVITDDSLRAHRTMGQQEEMAPSHPPVSETKTQPTKTKTSLKDASGDTSASNKEIFPSMQKSSSRRKLKKKPSSEKRSKDSSSSPMASPNTPVIYFPKNTPRQRRRWSLATKIEEEKDDDSSLGRRQTSIDAIASPPTSRIYNKESSGSKKVKKRSSSRERSRRTGEQQSNSKAGTSQRHSKQQGDSKKALPSAVPFHGSSSNNLDVSLTSQHKIPAASDQTRRRKSKRNLLDSSPHHHDVNRHGSKEQESSRERSRSRSGRELRTRSRSRSGRESRARSSSNSATRERQRSASRSNRSTSTMSSSRSNTVAIEQSQGGNLESTKRIEKTFSKDRKTSKVSREQDLEQGITTPKATNRTFLTMEKLYGQQTNKGAPKDSGVQQCKATEKIGGVDGTVNRSTSTDMADASKKMRDGRFSLKSATKEEDRERRRGSRRRLLESNSSSRNSMKDLDEVKGSAHVPLTKEKQVGRIGTAYTKRQDSSDDDSIDDVRELAEEALLEHEKSTMPAEIMSSSTSKILHAQERRRRRTNLGHQLLQRSLTALETGNMLSTSLHSTSSKPGKGLLTMANKKEKKEDVWLTRRRRHSLGKDEK